MSSERRKQIDESNALALLGLAIAAGLLTVGPVTLLAALALEPVVRRRSARELSRLALPALGFAVLLLPLTFMQVRAALDAALAYGVAQATDWSIFYLDAKGDRETMRRFGALMADTGRSARLFPDEPYDGWRGSGEEIANRLTEVIDFAEEGGGTYFRDQAIGLVRLACEAPAGPPRSEADFKERLALGALRALYRGHPEAAEVELYAERQVAEVRARYATFFGPMRGRLDSGFAFDDTDAGYLLLDGVRLKRSAQGLTRLLIEDFKQFAVARKDPDRRVLLILDEFSRVPGAAAAAVEVIETTAGFGAAMVLAPQMVEGMGSYEEAARIIGSVGTTFLHRVPNPERITAIAGTRREIDRSVSYDDAGSPERSSARYRDVPKVDPNHVRQLGVGACFVMAEGRAMRVQIAPAPQVAPELVSTPSGGLGQPG